ncbi:hypothetical protein E8K88_17900 [Lampropedia aestuarii]|uniref:Immunity protein 50 n=1 Tax=Lampropedia aestuarii TaxID=2562762 RepID=A0A4S5BD63_9BURK|nr:Imm50 family immunity protein [Lampropedia aestuarii]THJ29929.1 hypothetical protein E8K88_17900 [Lampropedia aestuarii]
MIEYLVHSNFYRKLFPSDPNFKKIIFIELTIKSNDAYITFDLPNIFPENPPRAWRGNKSNSTRLVFSFLSYSNLMIKKLSTENFCSLDFLEIEKNICNIQLSGEAGILSLDCQFISIGGIMPYFNE